MRTKLRYSRKRASPVVGLAPIVDEISTGNGSSSFAQYSYARVYRQFVALLGVKPDIVRENSAIFDNMLSRINGRVYYNLLNWYRALTLLPGFSINRDHMEVMMGVKVSGETNPG